MTDMSGLSKIPVAWISQKGPALQCDRSLDGLESTLAVCQLSPLHYSPIWRHCCVKLFPTRYQLLSGWICNWGHTVLHAPKRGGKCHNLASAIKHRIASYSVGQPDSDSANPTRNARRQLSSTSTISQAVLAKLEDGNVRAAIRLLMSEDSPAAPSP